MFVIRGLCKAAVANLCYLIYFFQPDIYSNDDTVNNYLHIQVLKSVSSFHCFVFKCSYFILMYKLRNSFMNSVCKCFSRCKQNFGT